jgi:hypothetical protein
MPTTIPTNEPPTAAANAANQSGIATVFHQLGAHAPSTSHTTEHVHWQQLINIIQSVFLPLLYNKIQNSRIKAKVGHLKGR